MQEEIDVNVDIVIEEKPVEHVLDYDTPLPAPPSLDTTPVRGYEGSLLITYNPLRLARIKRRYPKRVAPEFRLALPMPLLGIDKIRQMYEPRYLNSFQGKYDAAENLALSISGNRAIASTRNCKAIIMEIDTSVRQETPYENYQRNDQDYLRYSDYVRELLPSITSQNGNSYAPCIYLGARYILGIIRVLATPRGIIRYYSSEDST